MANNTKKTDALVQKLLGYIEEGKTKSEACLLAGVARGTIYVWEEEDPEGFGVALARAEKIGNDVRIKEAHRRGVQGYEEPVFGSLGEGMGSGQIGTVRRYSDRLLTVLLSAYDPRFRQTVPIEGTLTLNIADRMRDAEQRVKKLKN